MKRATAAAILLVGAGLPLAAGPAADGRQLAIDGCSACHQVTAAQTPPQPVFDPDQARGIRAPSFATIARKYRGRQAALRSFVQDPRHPMREQDWPRGDLQAILSYIQALSADSSQSAR